MLGRLEMDVEECIVAYNSLLKQIFEKKAHRIPFGRSGRLHSRFDSAKLKTAIEEVIVTQGYSTTEPFNDGKCRGCRVFVQNQSLSIHYLMHDLDLCAVPRNTYTESHACEVMTIPTNQRLLPRLAKLPSPRRLPPAFSTLSRSERVVL